MSETLEPFCSNPHCQYHEILIEAGNLNFTEGDVRIRSKYTRTSPTLELVTFYLCDQCRRTCIWFRLANEGIVV